MERVFGPEETNLLVSILAAFMDSEDLSNDEAQFLADFFDEFDYYEVISFVKNTKEEHIPDFLYKRIEISE